MSQSSPMTFSVKNLMKRRTQGEFVFELRMPEFEISQGQFVAIVGESGCGKSTLLDMMGLLLKPTSADQFHLQNPETGNIHDLLKLKDHSRSMIRRQLIGYVLQTGGLLPYLKVKDNILLTSKINQLKDASAFVSSICERLGIADQIGKYPAHLSGGQRQRVAIARALAHRPPFILADEPTAAVDKFTAREIRNTFKELSTELGVTVFMVTHDLDLVKDVSDRTFTFQVERESSCKALSRCIEKPRSPQSKGGNHGS